MTRYDAFMRRHADHRQSVTTSLKAGALLALAILANAPARAQSDDGSAAAYWTRERERMRLQAAPPRVLQRPTHLIRRAAPIRGYVREEGAIVSPQAHPAPEAGASDGARPMPSAEAPPSPAPVAGPSFTIAVLGDNIGTLLAQGLHETFATQPNVTILRKARENTGLVRDDYFDWAKAARDLVASSERIDAIVLMLGSNDRQALRDGAGSVDPRLPRWREIYAERAQNLARTLREKNVPLIWVGMPVMKNERLSNGLLELNEIFRETATQNGATYIDVWEAFVDDRQQFALYGPDLNGAITKLRAGDGVHFTRAGARKLAYFVEGDIKRLIEKKSPAIDPAIVIVPPLDNAPAPDSGQKSPQLALPAPAAAPTVVIPVRPEKGPVLPLTGLALSPGGELAGSPRQTDQRDQQSRVIVEQVLIQGLPMEEAPRGRADDFSWPRK
jgi:hypothetical protein